MAGAVGAGALLIDQQCLVATLCPAYNHTQAGIPHTQHTGIHTVWHILEHAHRYSGILAKILCGTYLHTILVYILCSTYRAMAFTY